MADGQVVFEIKGDASNVSQTVKQVTSNIQNESKKWDQAADKATGNIEKSFSSMAGKIVAGLTAAGIGTILLNWGKAAVEAASDLAEVQNVVDTVFGEGATQIETWAKKAGRQFGLTETQAKKFTSTLGAMMKSSGLAGDEIVSMSTDLAGLAADMASFYNLDFETAFDKIRSGISGETMPLKQLGINMSVANLNAFALAQGLEKTFDQMDQGEQTMLRYQYIMKATSDAQGDFEKTSDGFANAQRRIQTALDTISTVAGGFILNTIEPLVSGVAGFLEKLTTPVERTVIDDFNDIDVDTSQKMADLEETYNKASAIIKLIDEIGSQTVTLNNGSTISFEELFAELGNIEANGGDVRGYLESLGLDVDEVIQKYNVWKESTRQLTSLVPGLTGVINSETGAIDGGTDALQKNLDEWKRTEDQKLAWTAYYAKARALEEKKAELYTYEFDAGTKAKLRQQWEEAHQEFMKNRNSMDAGSGSWNNYAESQEYTKLLEDERIATEEYERQVGALNVKEEELALTKEYLIETYGEEQQAAEDAGKAASQYGQKTKEEWEETAKAIKAAEDAVKAMNDYYQSVLDSTEQAVNSTLKGFDDVKLAGDDLRKKSDELGKEAMKTEQKYSSIFQKWGTSDDALKKMSDSWDSLTDAEKDAYNEMAKIRNEQNEVNKSLDAYRPEGMKRNLEEQIAFMDEYLKNLEQLKEWGVNEDLIAYLSDGSKESAEYLRNLVKDSGETGDAAVELGEKFSEVQDRKKEFAESLTENKLNVDETYQGMVDTAMAAIEDLNLYEEAKGSLAETVSGMADGINEELPEVQAAVDALIAELDRLSGFGLNFGFDAGGGIELHLDGSNEKGLDYVPFDGYLSELHEGEGILTAEENRIWQRFKNGQAGHANVDYDALGGIMRDNVRAGGDVYLDGRTVGRVISDIQGNQYRALTRSGWQQ